MVDFFGKAYGWSVNQINEVYVEEALGLIDAVNEENLRKKADRLMSYLISLAGGFNPDTKLVEAIQEQLNVIHNELEHGEESQTNVNKPYWEVTELDTVALQRVKEELQKVKDSKN